jgi:hypothetical protein
MGCLFRQESLQIAGAQGLLPVIDGHSAGTAGSLEVPETLWTMALSS